MIKFGFALAHEVRESELYNRLTDDARAECNILIVEGRMQRLQEQQGRLPAGDRVFFRMAYSLTAD